MKINIGITIKVKDPKKDSLFSNGIRQNVIILQEIYGKCKNVDKSYIINTCDIDPEEYRGTTWEEYSQHIITSDQAKDLCDVVVLCHGNMHLNKYEELNKMGKKMVLQVLGAELNMFNESVLFKPEPAKIYMGNPYVETVWTSPHFYDRDRDFFSALYRCPVYEAPYIWDPRFIERHVSLNKNRDPDKKSLYKPSSSAKRISAVEPNINMVKTSTMPIVISELFYRKYPEYLKKTSMFGAHKIKSKEDLIDFVKSLDIFKDKKIFFESRYPIVWTLENHTDILLSHQSGCELNYVYLDAAWLGFPVVHNSPMMKELGWYYPENNSTVAVDHFNEIARNFDNRDHPDDKYVERSRKFASKYLLGNPENIAGYEKLIDMLMKK